jgi:hypothetical protein
MSTTFGALKTRIGTILQDPNGRTFTDGMLEELIYDALSEVGRIAPEQFTEDLTPVAYQMTYPLRDTDFSSVLQPEIEVMRVEIWDATTQPETFKAIVTPASTQFSKGQDGGWYVWGGSLYLPSRTVNALVGYEDTYVIRVWGYSPYVEPTDDSDTIDVTRRVEQALIWYVRYAALELLLANRNLFAQWQVRSGNTDMTPAGLMNEKNIALSEWRARSRSIERLRSEV